MNAIDLLDPIYGVVPGAADNTAGMQAAFAAAVAGPGVLIAPPGVYNHGHLDLVGVGSLTIRGAQGYQWWGPTTNRECRTVFNCIAQDDQDGIDAHQAQGLVFENIQFSYNEGFTGIVLNFGHPDIGVGANTCLVQRCHFTSDRNGTYITAKAMIGLANTVCTTIQDSSFMGAHSLIRGYDSPNCFCTDTRILGCSFERCTVGQIVDPGTFLILGNTFEFTHTATPCAITSDLSSTAFGADDYQMVVVQGNWFWDASSGAQKCIVQPPGVYWDLRMRDNWFHVFNNVHVEMHGPGTLIADGNKFMSNVPANAPTLFDLGDPTTAHKRLVRIVGNDWNLGSLTDNALTVKNYLGHNAVCIENNTNKGPWDTSGSGGSGGPPYDQLTGVMTLEKDGVVAQYTARGIVLSGNNTFHIENPVTIDGNLYLGSDLLMGQSGASNTVTYGNQVGTVPCYVSIFGALTIKEYTPPILMNGMMWCEDDTDTGLKYRIGGETKAIAFQED